MPGEPRSQESPGTVAAGVTRAISDAAGFRRSSTVSGTPHRILRPRRSDQPGVAEPGPQRSVHARLASGLGHRDRVAFDAVDAGGRDVPHAVRDRVGPEEPARRTRLPAGVGVHFRVPLVGRCGGGFVPSVAGESSVPGEGRLTSRGEAEGQRCSRRRRAILVCYRHGQPTFADYDRPGRVPRQAVRSRTSLPRRNVAGPPQLRHDDRENSGRLRGSPAR